jgi:hypothetical protein
MGIVELGLVTVASFGLLGSRRRGGSERPDSDFKGVGSTA